MFCFQTGLFKQAIIYDGAGGNIKVEKDKLLWALKRCLQSF